MVLSSSSDPVGSVYSNANSGGGTAMEVAIPYEIDARKFEGRLVYDESVKTPRPAILMQPDWAGVCPNTIEHAWHVAGKEYVVFMADMFGEGYGAKPKTVPELMQSIRTVREN